jgi:hypothetical protein
VPKYALTATGTHSVPYTEVAAIWTPSTEATASASGGAGPDWLTLCQRQLDTVGLLRGNWDNNGAQPVSAAVLTSARRLLSCLASADEIPQPRVNPSRRGGVQFEWEKGPRRFELEVYTPNTAELRFRDEEIGVEESIIREGQSLEKAIAQIRRVATGS